MNPARAFDPFDVAPVVLVAAREPAPLPAGDPFACCDAPAQRQGLWSSLAEAALLAWLDGYGPWNTAATCFRCGPVWTWPPAWDLVRCPWCPLREAGVRFPRPPEPLPALPRRPDAPRGPNAPAARPEPRQPRQGVLL